jgi:hypothetical protein
MAAIFEAPAEHEGVQEWEWEQEEGSHLEGSSEWEQAGSGEWEWEQPGSGEWESEWEQAGVGSGEWEWEQPGSGEWESEWEQAGVGSGEWEWEAGAGEWEADAFSFGGLLKGIGSIAKKALPMATKVLGSMIPGVGPIAGPLLGQLAQGVLGEGEAEAAAVEAEAFGGHHGEAEIGGSETAHEAALSELLASDAATASSEAEAASTISATLPLTITIMRAGKAVRPVMPVLTQANARVARAMRKSGPQGRQLQRAMPSIQRVAVGTIKSAARQGRPVTAPLAVSSMAAATRRVLGNPRRAEAVVRRNAALRQRTAPPHPRRALVYEPRRTGSHHPRRYDGGRW